MTEEPQQNRRNIAYTQPGEAAAKRILDRLPLGTPMEVARVAIAYAIREGMNLERPTDFGIANGSNYNIGSIDPGGAVSATLQALRPDLEGDPHRVLETFMSVGALAIDAKVASGEILSVQDLLGSTSEIAAPPADN